MLNRTIIFGAALLLASGAMAAPVGPEAALERIFPGRAMAPRSDRMSPAQMSLALSTEGLYLFANPAGDYVVAPADDRAPALLGYGSNFDPDNIPPAMRGWLQEYGRQMVWLAANPGATGDSDPADEDEREVIEPMVTTKWNQDNPYNKLCPSDKGGRSVTGCLATAIAQIIKYHEWPATHGTGTHSYEWNNRTLEFDYGSTVFEWDKMLDTYSNTTPELQRMAVATLMYACGVGVNMNYSSSASGATDVYISSFLVDNMDYDRGAAYLQRDWFEAGEWDNIVYSELKAGRPVLYCGQSNQGGHAFVCDGYAGNYYYHINWGWGGYADGNFQLSALNPYGQGIGGSGDGSGFNYSQSVVIGISRPADDEESDLFLPFYAYGGLAYAETPDGGLFHFVDEGESQGCYNFSGFDIDVLLGLKLEAEDGGVFYAPDVDGVVTIPGAEGYQISGFEGVTPLFPADLPAGSYSARVAGKILGSELWQDCLIPAGMNATVTVRKGQNGDLTFDGSDPDENSAIAPVAVAEALTDVYNLQGVKVRAAVSPADATRGLPEGIYIVNGRKISVK